MLLCSVKRDLICNLLDGIVVSADECLHAAVDVEAFQRVVQPTRPHVNRILSYIGKRIQKHIIFLFDGINF
jgi:hypothetical protein